MDPFRSKAAGVDFIAATGTTSIVTATHTSSTKEHMVTFISGSSDAAGAITLAYTQRGTAKTWKMRFGAAFQFHITFPPGAITCDRGVDIVLSVPAGAANNEANLGVDVLA